jgi:outer membrane immunogenic protein
MIKLGLFTSVAFLALGGAAFAADVSSDGVVSVPAPSGFEGSYIGGHIGYGSGGVSDLGILRLLGVIGGGLSTGGPLTFSGLVVGGQAGYNFAIDNKFIVGVEGDASYTNQNGSTVATSLGGGGATLTTTSTLNWTADLTAHAGYEIGQVMPYVLAGVAFANNTYGLTAAAGGAVLGTTSAQQTHVGYTIGGGVSGMFTDQLSGFVEARYSDYGIANYSLSGAAFGGGGGLGSINEPVSLTDTTIRTGLNFHF